MKLIGRHDYLEIEEILKPISLKFRLNKVYIFLCTVLVRTVPKLKGISLQQHFRMMESFRITYPDTMPDKKNLNINCNLTDIELQYTNKNHQVSCHLYSK